MSSKHVSIEAKDRFKETDGQMTLYLISVSPASTIPPGFEKVWQTMEMSMSHIYLVFRINAENEVPISGRGIRLPKNI